MPQSQYFQGLWHSFFFLTVKDGIIPYLSSDIFIILKIFLQSLNRFCLIPQINNLLLSLTIYCLPEFCFNFIIKTAIK